MVFDAGLICQGPKLHRCLEFNVHRKLMVVSDDTLSLIGEQTSYMSICVGEGQEEELQHLSVEQLRLKVGFTSDISISIRYHHMLEWSFFFLRLLSCFPDSFGSVLLSAYFSHEGLGAAGSECRAAEKVGTGRGSYG